MNLRIQNILLYTFFFSLNFEVWDPFYTEGNFSVAKLTGFLYALSLIPKIKYFLTVPRVLKSQVSLLLYFYIFLVFMNLINIKQFSSDFLQLSILQNLILFIFLLNHERINPGILEKSFISFIIGSLVLAGCFYFGIGLDVNVEGRASLFGDNENIIGIRMVTSVLILAHIILKYRKRVSKSKLLLLILAFIPLVTLNINTGSRLSFVSLFLGLSLVFVLFRSGGLLSKIITLSVGLVATILLFDLAMKSETLGIRLSKTFEEGNIAGRDEIWLSILPLIENNWIAGVGRTGYLEYVSHMYGVIISPHNVIIEIFAYSGIIGFVLFFGFISKIFYNAYRFFKKSNEVIPFVFIVPISGIILTAQILNFKLCWVIFAYAASRKLYLKSIST